MLTKIRFLVEMNWGNWIIHNSENVYVYETYVVLFRHTLVGRVWLLLAVIQHNNKNKEELKAALTGNLTWNMNLYCSSGFWTTHMLHPIVAGQRWPRLTAHTLFLVQGFCLWQWESPTLDSRAVVYHTTLPRVIPQHILPLTPQTLLSSV